MAVFLVLALCLVAGATCSAFEGNSLRNASTTIDQYPTVVQVEFLEWYIVWTQSCGGAVLTSVHILSSANCFSGYLYEPRVRRIRAGATHRDTGGIVSGIQIEHNHPSFGISYMDSDITVVRLESRLTFSPVIQQATIIIQGGEIPSGLAVKHVGWPTLIEAGEYFYNSDVLLAVNMETVDHETCGEIFAGIQNPLRLTENMVCASLPEIAEEEEADMCHADFGGPLIFNDIVFGIASWSTSCTNASFPTVGTKVAAYTDWIINTAI